MWSHLFSGVISNEVVELLVVYTFVKSAPNGPPSSQGDWLPKVCTSPTHSSVFCRSKNAFRIVVLSTCMYAIVASL